MDISKNALNDVVGLRQRGVQVRKGETGVVQEFNKSPILWAMLKEPWC